jgi:hypothetical protein
MNELRNGVQRLVSKETEKAYEDFGPFRSAHEGYALILEEVEESSDELDNVKRNLAALWKSVKNDEPSQEIAERVWIYAELMAAEAIQAAVTAKRFVDLLKRGNDNK